MQAMAMTAKEIQEFDELKDEFRELKNDFTELKNQVKTILTLVRGIAIGLAIGGFMFGLIKIPELLKFFTK